jgi:CHAD domain-containing protein/CYTH domain-containing protein
VAREPLFPLPVRAAVSRIAGEYLGDAEAGLQRLRDPRDAEALHDFRVAIRRLRSLLRAYRRWLGRAAGKKVRRRLRELGQATNAGRDAEVQLEWLGQGGSGLARRERSGVTWLARRLRQKKRDGYRQARKLVRVEFSHAADLVRRRLEGAHDGGPAFRHAFVTLLREHAADLEARLAAVQRADDEEEAHEARISAKRLRYLLEPVRAELPEARTAVNHLKGLQDILGELHDAHVLAASLAEELEAASTEKARRLHALAMAGDDAALKRERRRDERLGLVALAARARDRINDRFAALTGGWLGAAGRPFFAELGALGEAVAASGGSVERERKYLLDGLPGHVTQEPALQIDQGWLPGDRLRERLRRVRENGLDRYYRTVKLGAGERRVELEEETTAELFQALWPHTAGCRVAKHRYRVADQGLTWEIDAFDDRELWLAEVELPDAQTTVSLPAWLAQHVVREVTDDPAYVNLNLAR